MYEAYGKRVVDVVLALCALALLFPIMVFAALAIRIEDGGPSLFRQRRVGRFGDAFTLYKFRSMVVNTGDIPSAQASKAKITRVGSFIRRTNIDELPQLFNILKGDMSVVGPRPALMSQTQLCNLRLSNGALDCRPGLTGLAQINSFDGMPESKKAEWDGIYRRNISLVNDVKIIFGTFGYLLRPPPVY